MADKINCHDCGGCIDAGLPECPLCGKRGDALTFSLCERR